MYNLPIRDAVAEIPWMGWRKPMTKLDLRSIVVPLLAAVLLLSLGACTSTPQVNAAAEEKAIRATEAEFAKAAAAKDLEKALSFYADDAAMLDQNEPIAVGKAAIRESWTKMLAMPDLALNWAVDKVEVAKSGDMAYDYGSYTMSYKDPSGKKKVDDRGKYATVWKKQADGSWKAVLDMSNTDRPAPQPAAAKKSPPKRKRR
jgi:uncharacterized protein (TIGR02246 family)